MQVKRFYLTSAVIILLSIFNVPVLSAQSIATIKERAQNAIISTVPSQMEIGKIKVSDFKINKKGKVITIKINENFAYTPINGESILNLKEKLKEALGSTYSNYRLDIIVGSKSINEYVASSKRYQSTSFDKKNFITPLDSLAKYSKGMSGDIIALWQSHGWYFEPKLNRWEWQRARIFQTVEDLYTQSYVMPFLMPMLENAGAYVISPRERDTSTHEIIIDGDGSYSIKGYAEQNGSNKWEQGDKAGFAYNRSEYRVNENPFQEGEYRKIRATTKKNSISTSTWNADIPEDGEYAIYVSYATHKNSASDAVYKINYAAGSKEFKVNQKMGGSTWIYLGHFNLAKGKSKLPIVELSNYSQDANAVITADAVKIGGGYGNISRIVKGVSENVKSSEVQKDKKIEIPAIDYEYQLSNYPRFTEGARYWLQWAGIPDTVYSPSGNINDYTDDYRCRGSWVNYLAGGSEVLPKRKGLNIPVDLAFAFHTDAGTTRNDSIIGTLGIYYSDKFSRYANGMPRISSRHLTDLIMTNIVDDIRVQYEPQWTRRGMWDKSYYEARVPEVPTMLLELLSHQNFADMKYGLDPSFRFTVSRSIYKGMLQFLAERDGRSYKVQPLPVNSFGISPMGDNRYALKWKATGDTLCEDKALPTKYIIYERINDGAFKEIGTTSVHQYNVLVNDYDIHSYKIVAMNEGGRSFPSEILALGRAEKSKGEVLVVNGFTRVSAPDTFDSGEIAGFYDIRDHGVPYGKDISFIGSQFEYRRDIPWMDDDAAGFGASRANYETKVIAGNTFDYAYIHGEAIMKAGYSFVSAGIDAVTAESVKMSDFKNVDLILGKQKETVIGRGACANRYKTFPVKLQNEIAQLTQKGGSIFVSGAFLATDIWDNKNATKDDVKFAEEVLGYKWRVGQASVMGEAYTVPTIHKELKKDKFSYHSELNEDVYAVESPDSLFPADASSGSTFMRYTENNLIAGIVTYKKGYKTCVVGFPFETIKDSNSRAKLMTQILNFFDKQ